jgi:hypothetical protein
MTSRWLVNLLLLMTMVALGLVALYEPGIDKPAEAQAITALTAGQVERIHINRPLRDDLILVKHAQGDWWIDRATPLPADDFKVRALTGLVEQKPLRSYPATELQLADLQLDPPYAAAIFNDIAIEFGNLEPIDDLRYVRVNDRVHLIPDNYLQLMETSFTQFVRNRLFDAKSRVTAVQLPGLLVRETDNDWATEPPQQLSADILQQFLSIWQEAQAIAVQAGNPELDGEPVDISLAGAAQPVRFLIIAREPELILARPDYGIQYRMGNRAEALLTLDAAESDSKD